MAVTKPRNRTVLFRLTQEEYVALQAACSAGSARSLSDYARERILADASATGSARLESQVGALADKVERLVLLIEGGGVASAKRAEGAAATAAYAPRLVSNS